MSKKTTKKKPRVVWLLEFQRIDDGGWEISERFPGHLTALADAKARAKVCSDGGDGIRYRPVRFVESRR